MAKQAGFLTFTGTLGGLTGYMMDGKPYVKRKTEIPRRHILKNRNFENTRRNAFWFRDAQKIAAEVYRKFMIPERDRKKVWYPLRNRAQVLVRKQLPREEILRILHLEFPRPAEPAPAPVPQKQRPVLPHVSLPPLLQKEEIQLGRHCGRMDPVEVLDGLVAYNSLIRRVLNHESPEENRLMPIQETGRRR